MDTVAEITRDCLNAIVQLRNISEKVPQPELLHTRMRSFIDDMMRKANEEGMSKQEIKDIAYAVVSLADEIGSAKPDPLGRFWMDNPLQLRYFGENVAGDEFFRRLQGLRGDRHRVSILRLYYACLLLGFQGQFGVRGGQAELMTLTESVGQELAYEIDAPNTLSPRADRPDEAIAKSSGKSPLLIAAALIVLASVGGFVGLRLSLSAKVNALVDDLTAPEAPEGR